MGARGPAPQPAKLQVLKGNGVDRRPDHRKVKPQPRAVPGIPPMPDKLGEHGERIWKHVTPELHRMGILGRIDMSALEAYCRLYEEWRNHPGGHGYATLTMTMINVGSKLGLDPMSRMRMTVPEAVDDDQEDVFGAG